MYVKIGKYASWVMAHEHLRWLEKHIGEDRVDKFTDFIRPVYQAWNNRPWNNRKVKVVIHPYDTWSMDATLALIILPMLKQLKDTKHGSPYVDDEDVPAHLRSTSAIDKNSGDIDDDNHLRWNYVLDEMIWAFEQINSDWEDQYHENGFDKEGYFAHYKKMQDGTKLFGKYYFSLWT